MFSKPVTMILAALVNLADLHVVAVVPKWQGRLLLYVA